MQEMKLVTELREVAAQAALELGYPTTAGALRGYQERRSEVEQGIMAVAGGMLAHLQANYVEVETDYHPTWVGGGPAWYGNYPGQIGTAQTIVVPKLPAKKTKDELLAEAATLLKQHGVEGRKLAEEIEGA